uniref:Uncharacterized protein n=1 Tax=Anguilla anguilla TaxID=7936 RepID=A0A0E9QDM1_ANGAN
MSAPCWLG